MKYSIIIPAYNGRKYLPACISSVLSQNYSDYELIVSDDYSTDGTAEYIDTLKHPNIKVLHTPHKMSMTEHWEWVLVQACGEWLIFIGQDDGLQAYFFELADILVKYADRKKIKAITSRGAFYYWPRCDGEFNVQYRAIPKITVCNYKIKTMIALTMCDNFNSSDYFSLPQMYTSSLFHKSLLEQARQKQNGKIFCTHPQDANLAAIGCRLTDYYLYSGVPLGWGGTSPSSAGRAISHGKNKELKNTYLEKIKNSELKCYAKMGSFELNSAILYFWGALQETKQLPNCFVDKILSSKLWTYIIIAAAKKRVGQEKNHLFVNVERINGLNDKILGLFIIFLKFLDMVVSLMARISHFIDRKIMRLPLVAVDYLPKDYQELSAVSAEVYVIIKTRKILIKCMRNM